MKKRTTSKVVSICVATCILAFQTIGTTVYAADNMEPIAMASEVVEQQEGTVNGQEEVVKPEESVPNEEQKKEEPREPENIPEESESSKQEEQEKDETLTEVTEEPKQNETSKSEANLNETEGTKQDESKESETKPEEPGGSEEQGECKGTEDSSETTEEPMDENKKSEMISESTEESEDVEEPKTEDEFAEIQDEEAEKNQADDELEKDKTTLDSMDEEKSEKIETIESEPDAIAEVPLNDSIVCVKPDFNIGIDEKPNENVDDEYGIMLQAMIHGSEIPTSTRTYQEDGGSYNLYDILNNFNIFAKEDVTTIHTVGEVAIGGDLDLSGNMVGKTGAGHQGSSYVKGKVNNYGGDAYHPDNDDVYLYIGSSNTDSNLTYTSDAESGPFRINDNYIDFDEAFEAIQKEVDNNFSKDALAKQGVNLKDVQYGQIKGNGDTDYYEIDFNSAGYPMLTVPKGQKNIVVIDYSEDINIQGITCNDLSASENNKDGTNILWVFPNAKNIRLGSMNMYGHVIAPNADIQIDSGNYNGCIIAKSIDSKAEGHKWGYSGTTVEPKEEPSPEPSEKPSPEPSEKPSPEPSEKPSPEPSEEPSPEPSEEPSPEPSEKPSPEPSEKPSPEPSEKPSPEPSEEPSPEPSEEPSPEPSEEPSPEPSEKPSPKPSEEPKTPEAPKPTEKPEPVEMPKSSEIIQQEAPRKTPDYVIPLTGKEDNYNSEIIGVFAIVGLTVLCVVVRRKKK